MNNCRITFILSGCLLLVSMFCLGQSKPNIIQVQALDEAVNGFNAAIGQQSWLYNGAGYNPGRLIKGNPNFNDTVSTSNGSLIYCGFTYNNVPLLYDIYKDLLASVLFDETSWYSLTSEKVSEFNLMGHHFIRLATDSISRRIIKPGYYDDLYTNKLQVLVKRTKIIHVTGPLKSADDYYETKDQYYLKKGERYYPVNGQGDFIAVLKDHEKELNQYLKDKRIKFRNQPEQFMVMLATYYDELTN